MLSGDSCLPEVYLVFQSSNSSIFLETIKRLQQFTALAGYQVPQEFLFPHRLQDCSHPHSVSEQVVTVNIMQGQEMNKDGVFHHPVSLSKDHVLYHIYSATYIAIADNTSNG